MWVLALKTLQKNKNACLMLVCPAQQKSSNSWTASCLQLFLHDGMQRIQKELFFATWMLAPKKNIFLKKAAHRWIWFLPICKPACTKVTYGIVQSIHGSENNFYGKANLWLWAQNQSCVWTEASSQVWKQHCHRCSGLWWWRKISFTLFTSQSTFPSSPTVTVGSDQKNKS